jgi:hypothetical protein
LIDSLIIDVRFIFYIFLFYFLDNNIPGPNAYKNHSLIGCNIFDSRYQSPSFVTLSKKFKIRDRNAGNPGPGSYIRFSEFGILAPKKDKEKEKKEKEKEKEENENINEEGKDNFEENEQNNNKETDEGNNKINSNENEDKNDNEKSNNINDNKNNEISETL